MLRLGPDAAMADLQQLKGIGPFYAALIVIRGTGFTDVLPTDEPKSLAHGAAAVRPARRAEPGRVRADRRELAAVANLGDGPDPRGRIPRIDPDQLSSRTAASPIAVSSSSTRLAASPIGT